MNKIVPGKKKLTVKAQSQKASGITGYQVKYRKVGSKKWNSKTFKAGSSNLVLKKLKKDKKYQVKVRAFVKVNKKTYYGAFSKTVKSKAVK